MVGDALGSAIMRSTWSANSVGSGSVPLAASSNNSSSGIEFQRKYDKREASSYGVTGTGDADGVPSTPTSTWYKKNGDCNMASSTSLKPCSAPEFCCPNWYRAR